MNLSNVRFIKSVSHLANRPLPRRPEVAVVGRSNVGKSSMINSLFNRRHLAKISSTPGKTRLINYYTVDDQLYFVDLPGYGFTKKLNIESEEWKKLIERYLSDNKDLKLVIVLIDCRHMPMDADILMLQWLDFYTIPFRVILTKRDKVSNNQFNVTYNKIKLLLPEQSLLSYSAKSHQGREEVRNIISMLIKNH